MTYAYKRVTVSGMNIGTEGTITAINLITDFMVNDCGWSIADDRRNQGGSNSLASTCKIVLKNNKGEVGNTPEWYLTVASGTAPGAGSSALDLFIATAHDTGTHAVPASGVSAPLQTTRGGVQFLVDSDGYFNMWMFGDKDSIVVLTNRENIPTWFTAGKVYPFLDNNYEPYGLYLTSTASDFNATATNVRGIVGNGPPISLPDASDGNFIWHGPSTSQEPRLGLPAFREPVFTLLPLVYVATDTTNKGAIGVVRNMWAAIPSTAGWVEGSILTASGSGRTYLAFTASSASSVLRTV